MRVQDIVDRNHPFIYSDALATRARAILRNSGLRVLPVVDERKRLIGTISRGSIMTITSSVSSMRVKGIMSPCSNPATLDMDVVAAVREMLRLDEWCTPVVRSSQDHTYVGVLGLGHLIAELLRRNVARLSTPLSEIVITKQLLLCSPDDEVAHVWQKLRNRSFTACPVIEKGKPIGMVTQQDLLESGAFLPGFEAKKGRFKASSRISSVMRTPVISLGSTDTIRDAAKLMVERNIGRVPIIDDQGKLIGIVDREDIVKALIK